MVNRRHFPSKRETLRRWKVVAVALLKASDGLNYLELDEATGYVYGAAPLPSLLGTMRRAGIVKGDDSVRPAAWSLTEDGKEWIRHEGGDILGRIVDHDDIKMRSEILSECFDSLYDNCYGEYVQGRITIEFFNEIAGWIEGTRLALEEGVED